MKTVVITGGNSGIGQATAKALAKKGFRIIICGNDAAKTKNAEKEIQLAAPGSSVESIASDISTLAGMKKLAEEVKTKTDKIDALVLSAGVILPDHQLTADGNEKGFAIQYLSRFALTHLLLPELQNAKRASIVHVGAPTMKNARIHFEDLSFRKGFSMMKALGQEMLANHLFVQEFAKRFKGSGIVMNIAHVGIAKTGIMRHSNFILRLLVDMFGTAPDKAAANFVYLASDESVNFSGYFLNKPGKPYKKEEVHFDSAVADRLWNTSINLIKPIL